MRRARADDRLIREIAEQPAVARRLLARDLSAPRRALRGRSVVYLAARGSSDNAATYGKYLFESHARIVAALAAPSLFTLYDSPPRLRDAAVIGISQSGAAPDVAGVLATARAMGAATIAVTNGNRSPVARSARHVVLLGTGAERSVAATKTYTATCLALARLAGAPVDGAVDAIALGLATRSEVERLAGRMRGAALAVIGRGYTYAIALEVALKVKELAGIWAEPHSAADFEHGPISLAIPGSTVLLLAAKGPTVGGMRALARRLRARDVRVLAITDDRGLAADSADAVLLEAQAPEHVLSLALVVPGQLLARELAIRRGRDLDRPAGLRKVTRTR